MRKTLGIMAPVLALALAGCVVSAPVSESTPAPTVTGQRVPVPLLMGRLPTNASEAPDDIVPTPGGSAYRANVHEQGVPGRWPSIQTMTTRLAAGSETISVGYRPTIVTEAGQIRNNLLHISREGGFRGIGSITDIGLYTVGAPSGIEFAQGGAGGLPGTLATVLVMTIPEGIRPGRHDFGIGIEVQGKNYGTLPCTIEVSR